MQTTTLEHDAPILDLAPWNETIALIEPLVDLIKGSYGSRRILDMAIAPSGTAAKVEALHWHQIINGD